MHILKLINNRIRKPQTMAFSHTLVLMYIVSTYSEKLFVIRFSKGIPPIFYTISISLCYNNLPVIQIPLHRFLPDKQNR